ncbi:hypothetical protein JOQ06_011606, partial [Pogonophryne albipinna]
PDAPLSASVPPRQPLPLPQRENWVVGGTSGLRGVETSATLKITEDSKIQTLLCVSLEAREEWSMRELCKCKLENFLMEIA